MVELLLSPGSLISAGGWLAVVAAVIVAMVRGWLIPSSQVDRLVRAYEAQAAQLEAQRDDWRETARAMEARSDLLAENQRRMLEGLDTTNALVTSLATVVKGEPS